MFFHIGTIRTLQDRVSVRNTFGFGVHPSIIQMGGMAGPNEMFGQVSARHPYVLTGYGGQFAKPRGMVQRTCHSRIVGNMANVFE